MFGDPSVLVKKGATLMQKRMPYRDLTIELMQTHLHICKCQHQLIELGK
jgi:hypothetical protein